MRVALIEDRFNGFAGLGGIEAGMNQQEHVQQVAHPVSTTRKALRLSKFRNAPASILLDGGNSSLTTASTTVPSSASDCMRQAVNERSSCVINSVPTS